MVPDAHLLSAKSIIGSKVISNVNPILKLLVGTRCRYCINRLAADLGFRRMAFESTYGAKGLRLSSIWRFRLKCRHICTLFTALRCESVKLLTCFVDWYSLILYWLMEGHLFLSTFSLRRLQCHLLLAFTVNYVAAGIVVFVQRPMTILSSYFVSK